MIFVASIDKITPKIVVRWPADQVETVEGVGGNGGGDRGRALVGLVRGLGGDYTLIDTEARTITRLCRELNGIPLAIELAARFRLLDFIRHYASQKLISNGKNTVRKSSQE